MPISAPVREQLSPPPRLFSISRHFRALRPHAGLARLFLSFVVISIMAALKVLHEVTACIYKGEEKPVMKWSFLTKVEKLKGPQVISSGLKCFWSRSTGERTWNPGLQVKASVQAIDTRARISPWTSFRNRFR